MTIEAILTPIAPNRGPRRLWRCHLRNAHGQRCRFRSEHEGAHRAFGHEFTTRSVRRRARKVAV